MNKFIEVRMENGSLLWINPAAITRISALRYLGDQSRTITSLEIETLGTSEERIVVSDRAQIVNILKRLGASNARVTTK